MDYRREISGLRAVAVVPVVLHHAGVAGFGGGFVGVDVFFVISGFLIGSIVIREMDAGAFDLRRFYARRARRILPALFVVVACCLPAAWALLPPTDMARFARSVAAVGVFASNLLFWRESGYFDTAAALKPLLHTWSLAVEEQFYIVFPLAMLAAWRRGTRAIVAGLAVAAALSLGAAHWAASAWPAAAFYLPPFRAWELMLGVLAAFVAIRAAPAAPRWLNEALALAGLAAILAAVALFDDATRHPGLLTLAPTLGAVGVLLFAGPGTLVGAALSRPALEGIGLISYSLYLWHQPVFAFHRHLTLRPIDAPTAAGLIALCVALAVATYVLVEQPCRRRPVARRRVFAWSAVGCAVLVAAGAAGHASQGLRFRFADYRSPAAWADVHPCHGAASLAAMADPLGTCLGGPAQDGRRLFLVGDSHAHQLIYPLRAIGAELGRAVRFINTERAEDFPRSLLSDAATAPDRVLDHLRTIAAAGDVIVVGLHRGRFNDRRDAHLPLGDPPPENAEEAAFVRNFLAANAPFAAAGVAVALVLDGPLLPDGASVERCLNETIVARSACAIDEAQDRQTRTRQERAYRAIAAQAGNVVLHDAAAPLFRDGVFDPVTPERDHLMFDRHHLSERGALLLRDSLAAAIRAASG